MKMDRRCFMGAATATFACWPNSLKAQETTPTEATGNATDDIRVAVIGLRQRGVNHLMGLSRNVVAVCDADRKVLEVRSKEASEKNNRKLDTFVDYRKLLERQDIDAVSIATPNHLHAIIAVAAMQAGKHVYVEKPLSHNIWEGQQVVNAAARYGRIAQCGTQARSSSAIQEAVQFVRDGNLGAIQYAIGTCYKPRKSIGKLPQPLKLPEYIDYDLWCGPAAKNPLYRPSLHYDWHWDFNTGNGDTGNQGIHQMDVARWFLGQDGLPNRTVSIGGRLGYTDAGDTPNTQVVLHDYDPAPLIFETRGLPKDKSSQSKWLDSMDNYRGSQIGVIVQCADGHVVSPSSYGTVIAFDRDGQEIQRWTTGKIPHYQNWLNAIQENDSNQLNAPVVEGHRSTALCHLGNISHSIGTECDLNEIGDRLKDGGAGELFEDSYQRMLDHLKRNEIDLAANRLTCGGWIELDSDRQQPKNNPPAEKLWTREYRKPFVVPDLSAETAPA